jgi:hypothetical protein
MRTTRQMSTALLACSLVAASVYAQSQQAGPPVQSPPAVDAQKAQQKTVLPSGLDFQMTMAKSSWSLAYEFGRPEPKYAAKGVEQAVRDFDAFAASAGTDEQHVFSQRYRTELRGAIGSLGLVGKELGEFVYKESPAIFAWKGDALAVIVANVASGTVFNTLKLDVNQRAVMALRRMILPSLKAFDAFKDATDVKYYGMTVVYGSKDFLDKSPLATVAESLTLVVSADLCRKFVGGELTEDEMVSGADLFISDRDMVTGIRKIKPTLQ